MQTSLVTHLISCFLSFWWFLQNYLDSLPLWKWSKGQRKPLCWSFVGEEVTQECHVKVDVPSKPWLGKVRWCGSVSGMRRWELGTEVRAHWLSVACWWCVFHVLQARMSGMKPVCLKWVRKTTSDTKQGWVTCTHKYDHAYKGSWQ